MKSLLRCFCLASLCAYSAGAVAAVEANNQRYILPSSPALFNASGLTEYHQLLSSPAAQTRVYYWNAATAETDLVAEAVAKSGRKSRLYMAFLMLMRSQQQQ